MHTLFTGNIKNIYWYELLAIITAMLPSGVDNHHLTVTSDGASGVDNHHLTITMALGGREQPDFSCTDP